MFKNEDLETINKAIDFLKVMREEGMKASKDLILSDGTSIKIYHLGTAFKTIRIDIKG